MLQKCLYSIALFLPVIIVAAVAIHLPSTQPKQPEQYVRHLIYDPLLALPGTNLADYQTSIDILKDSRQQIVQANTYYSSEVMQDFYEFMYPLEWLEALGTLEQTRRVVVAQSNPSDENIREYQLELEDAIDTYITYTSELITWYRTNPQVLSSSPDGVQHFNGFTSFDYALRNLQHYLLEMQQQKAVAQSRWECYLGTIPCLATEIPPPIKVKTFDESSYDQDIYDIVHAVREQFDGEHPYGYKLARLSSSACTMQTQGTYYHLWHKPYSDDRGQIFKTDPLNDVLVRALDDETFNNSRYHQAYKQLGGSLYEMQSLGNYYVCPDIVNDVTRINSLLYLYTEITEHDMFVDLEISNIKLQQRLAQIEDVRNRIIESNVVDEHTGYLYAQQIWLLLYEFTDELLVTELGSDTTRQLAEQLLTYRLGTHDMAMLINSVANDNSAIVSYAPFGQWPYIDDFLITRSASSLLLGGHNPSIIPNNVSWVQDYDDTTALTKYSSYRTDLADTINLQEFIRMLIINKEVNYQLLEQASRSNQ